MSSPPIAIAFFDTARDLYGTARAGATLLFSGRTPTALAEGPEVSSSDGRVRAELAGQLSLDLEPLWEPVELGGVSARICKVSGEVAGRQVDCLGTVSETTRAPAWQELHSLRSISALVDRDNAFLALSRRPAGVAGHGEELVTAWLLEDGRLHQVEDPRISTVYDGGGRQRSAGLELWLPGEEWPRRGSGVAVAGSSLELEGMDVHAAVFRWRLSGREGTGAYELMVRTEPPRAA